MTKKQLFALLIVISLVAVAGIAGARSFFAYQPHGFVLKEVTPASDFTLNAAAGKQVSLSDYQGKVVLLYFGYTHCPDVCPTTLADLRVAISELGEAANDIQVIMVSVDPERDSPEWLADYVHRFDDRFLGVTGPLDRITQLATAYDIHFHKHEGSVATGYLIDHSAKVLVIDRQGDLRMFFPFGETSEEMAEDIQYMVSL